MGRSERSAVAFGSGERASWSERGQAQLELLASVPLMIAVAAVALQLMAVGYAQSLADGSAEAAALAIAAGRAPQADEAARAALPGWAGDQTRVEIEGGSVAVELRPPGLLLGIAKRLEVRSTAWARPERREEGSG